jgi:hypothetical protein
MTSASTARDPSPTRQTVPTGTVIPIASINSPSKEASRPMTSGCGVKSSASRDR